MVGELRVTKAGTFHKLGKPLTNAAIDDLFLGIRKIHETNAHNHFSERRRSQNGVTWSALCFSYEQTPAFLEESTAVRDSVTGFLLLVEYKDHLAIFKARLEIPSRFSSIHLTRVPASKVDAAIANASAKFEKLRLRNMSTSKFALRSKTLEADNLEYAVGPAGSSRYAPQAYTVRTGGNHYSATPNTGRISMRSDPVDYVELIKFSKAVIDNLSSSSTTTSPFIQTFARSIDLESIAHSNHPEIISIDVASLVQEIYEEKSVRLIRRKAGVAKALPRAEIDLLLTELEEAFEINGAGKLREIVRPADRAIVGKIAVNKSRIALRDLTIPRMKDVIVESTKFTLGAHPNAPSFREYLEDNDAFIVLFDDLSLAYINGTLYRDNALIGGGTSFLKQLRTEPLLATVTSEKGKFKAHQTEFDKTSTFGVIVQKIAQKEEVLVCADLGDEWADFIGVMNKESPPMITFYHAKHGKLSLGATPFHVSVSQAQKNLGRMSLPVLEVRRKLVGWKKNYIAANKARTKIARIVRGKAASIADEFEAAGSAPDAIRRVFIVTSALSKNAVTKAFAKIAAGERPSPHFVQLYWLLMSFYSACIEMGAVGYVICQE